MMLTAEEIISQYGRMVSSLCWRMTRDEEVAREAAQEVWVALQPGADFEVQETLYEGQRCHVRVTVPV